MLPILLVLGATGALLEIKRLVQRPPQEGDLYRLQQSEEKLKRVLQVPSPAVYGSPFHLDYISLPSVTKFSASSCEPDVMRPVVYERSLSDQLRWVHKSSVSQTRILATWRQAPLYLLRKYSATKSNSDGTHRGHHTSRVLTNASSHASGAPRDRPWCVRQEVQRELQQERSEHERDQEKINELEQADRELRRTQADLLARKNRELEEVAREKNTLNQKVALLPSPPPPHLCMPE